MLSIGDIARSTGTSRRMLRHWERLELIEPAEVDEVTGYRRYAPSQIGRVRAVASLRALGFGLEAIGDLLDADLTEERLVALLRKREQELVARIDDDSTNLAQVRSRLLAFEKGHEMISDTLELGALPGLHLAGASTSVLDESEIGGAVTKVLGRLREAMPAPASSAVDLVLVYDGRSDEQILVSAGHPSEELVPGLQRLEVAAVDQGVKVTFAEAPADIGDAWIAIDTRLAEHGLRTSGVYRQVVTAAGPVLLQAPVIGR